MFKVRSYLVFKGTVPQNIFPLKCGRIGCIDLWNIKGLQKYPYKKKENVILYNFCGFFGPWNYVSKTLRGTDCIAPKLRGAQVEVSKTLRGTGWGVQNSAGKICLQYLPCRVLDPSTFAPQFFGPFNLCPAEFCSNATCAPRNFGDIVSGTKIITKIIRDFNFLSYFKAIFVNL